MIREYDGIGTPERPDNWGIPSEGSNHLDWPSPLKQNRGLVDLQWEITGEGSSQSTNPRNEPGSRRDDVDLGNPGIVEHLLRRFAEQDILGKEHLERYMRHKYRQNIRVSTLRVSLCVLAPFLNFLKASGASHLGELSRGNLAAFIEHEQDRGLKASSVNTRMKVVKAFVRFLMEEGVVGGDVLSRRLTIRVADGLPRAMAPEDLRQVLGVIEDVRNRAMVIVLLRTGMRIGELLHTKVEDVLMDERKILIHEAQKNRVGRVVYLSDDAADALKGWFEKREPQKEFLFYARGRANMCYSTAAQMFQGYLERAGLRHKGYSLHSLRHSFATELLNAGMPLECLQVLLGHSTLEMTRRYARLTDKTRKEEYFKAMAHIEKEQEDDHCGLDRQLQEIFEEEELLGPHGEELPEQP